MVNGTTVSQETWYSVQQAAEIYRVHPNTIRAWIKSKTIPHRQVERAGQLVYEVAISDDDAALLRDKEDRERMAETIAELRVQCGMERALREQAEAKVAPLEKTIRILRANLADREERLNHALGEIDTLREEKLDAQDRVEERAEEIGRLQGQLDAEKKRNNWLSGNYDRSLELLRGARNYYWRPGLWPAIRRTFRTFRGFSRVP